MKVASTKIVSSKDMSNNSKSTPAESLELSVSEIETLLDVLAKHDVSEFELERGETKISLRRGKVSPVQPQLPPQIVFAGGSPGYGPMYAPQNNYVPNFQPGNFQQPAGGVDNSSGRPEPTGRVDETKPALKPLANHKEVSSPMVGTFYRRPAVDSDPYVQVGDTVKKGEVLCIIEAMKLMNEIESDVGGKIVEICLEDGQMVEYGEVLFRIEPL